MKVAIWGVGSHAQRYIIPSLARENSKMKLIGCFSRNSGTLKEICEKYNLTSFCSEQELLSSKEIEGIVLTTPSMLHSAQGASVIEAGKHLFSEKSLFLDPHYRNLYSTLAKENNVKVNELFMFKFHPQQMMISELLKSGKLGEVSFCNVSFTIPHLPKTNNRYNPNLGGGALFDVGCYPIAFSRSLFGSDQAVRDSLLIYEREFEVDTSGFCTLESENGVISNLQWGFGLTYTNKVEIFGSKGNLISKSIFSKNPEIQTKIEIIDSKNHSEKFDIRPANHFDIMFDELISEDGLDWVLSQSKMIEQIVNGDKSRTD